MSLHTWHHQGPRKARSCAILTLNSPWGRVTTGGQKKCYVYACRVTWVVPTLCNPMDCGLPGFSVRAVLQARILECIGQYWLHTLVEHYISCCPSHQLP